MSETPVAPDLQFERAELAEPAAQSVTCSACQRAIASRYYEAAGQTVCEACRDGLLAARDAGSRLGRLGRATLFGVGAAVVGSAVWYGVSKLTGYEFGLIAILIGLLVGGAVRAGSRRRGGWAYQALAMFLTYASIVSTYFPPILQGMKESAEEHRAGAPASSPAGTPDAVVAGERAANEPVAAAPASPAEPASTTAPPHDRPSFFDGHPFLALLVAAALLMAIAFAAPFLGGFQNFMAWIILAIGLYEAWKLNKKQELVFAGPFALGGPRPIAAPPAPEPPPLPLAP